MSSADGTGDRAVALAAVLEALNRGRAVLPPGLEADAELGELLDEIGRLYRFTLAVSQGDLDQTLTARGSMAGALKTLHASLRHLTWQTKRVAAGDFSQRVDFMGEFAESFNSMVVALGDARAELARRNEELQELARKLEELAVTDALTGVFNRRKLNELTVAELGRAERYGEALSLFILDIDHFKLVNDTFGHEAGDEVLVGLAEELREGIRATDSVARWGGEEFVVLSPGMNASGLAEGAERLRAAIAAKTFGAVGTVTASFGVAEYQPGETADELLGRADVALYRAKENGRNRVEVAE